jgi:hypothetical protein
MMAKKNTEYSARRLTTEDAADDFALGEHTEIAFAHRLKATGGSAIATIQRHRIISGPTATVNRGSVGITPTTRFTKKAEGGKRAVMGRLRRLTAVTSGRNFRNTKNDGLRVCSSGQVKVARR